MSIMSARRAASSTSPARRALNAHRSASRALGTPSASAPSSNTPSCSSWLLRSEQQPQLMTHRQNRGQRHRLCRNSASVKRYWESRLRPRLVQAITSCDRALQTARHASASVARSPGQRRGFRPGLPARFQRHWFRPAARRWPTLQTRGRRQSARGPRAVRYERLQGSFPIASLSRSMPLSKRPSRQSTRPIR